MPHRREDVVAHAVALLDAHGLGALTMRRLGTELGVQASAIYHHFANKQLLLAAVADEILARGPQPSDHTVGAVGAVDGDWPGRVRGICVALRVSMLAVTDGADVVATVWAFGLGARAPAAELEQALVSGGVPTDLANVASRALLHYVFGHTFEEQTARQAVAADAVARSLDSIPDFNLGLELVIDGLSARLTRSHRRPPRAVRPG